MCMDFEGELVRYVKTQQPWLVLASHHWFLYRLSLWDQATWLVPSAWKQLYHLTELLRCKIWVDLVILCQTSLGTLFFLKKKRRIREHVLTWIHTTCQPLFSLGCPGFTRAFRACWLTCCAPVSRRFWLLFSRRNSIEISARYVAPI